MSGGNNEEKAMQRSGTGSGRGGREMSGAVTLNRVVRELIDLKVGGASHVAIWEKAPHKQQQHVQRP